MDEYPSNNRLTPPETKPDTQPKVTTGKVIVKKPSLGRRLSSAFTGEDGKSVVQHVVWDVLIPAAKEMIADASREAVDRALWGESRGPRRGSGVVGGIVGSTLASRVNYNSPNLFADPRNREAQQRPNTRTSRGVFTPNDIVLETRHEAELVLAKMQDLINRFQQVTFADVCEIVGITGEYTYERFGWVSLESAQIRLTRDGYLLVLPNPVQLN